MAIFVRQFVPTNTLQVLCCVITSNLVVYKQGKYGVLEKDLARVKPINHYNGGKRNNMARE